MTDEISENAPNKDLFGEPLYIGGDERGRPKLKLTPEIRQKVAILRAGGMEREDIADAIGCSERTLRTYFLPELNEGVAQKKAEVILAMHAEAVGGSVTAQKAFLALTSFADATPKATAPGATKPTPATGAEEQPAGAKPGKKEAAEIEAESAHKGTEWDGLLRH